MKDYPSLDDIAGMLGRGELPNTRPGMTMDELMKDTAEKIRICVCGLMAVPLERVKLEILDIGLDGKMAVSAEFDPELTDEEGERYKLVMRAIANVLGSRPPWTMAEA